MKEYLTEEEKRHAEIIDRIRLLFGIVWAAIVLVAVVLCIKVWGDLGCSVASFIAAFGFYLLSGGAIWYTVDKSLRESK